MDKNEIKLWGLCQPIVEPQSKSNRPHNYNPDLFTK
jgi:hypothetical protein